MHRRIRDSLEDYLGGSGASEDARAIEVHLASCPDCRRTVDNMRRQAGLLRDLRPPGDLEPEPGFYARVIDRIESERAMTIWNVFLEPVFSRRLAYVSLTLIVVLGTLIATGGNPQDPMRATYQTFPEAVLAGQPVSPTIGDDIDHDRDVVLVNLATYEF